MTNTITLPRSVVEQALKLWDAQSIDENYDYGGAFLLWDEHARPEDLALQFRAALEQPDTGNPVSVPEGWKLVPSALTDAQRQAAQDAWWNACNGEMYWEKIYAAMLAAAPQPPAIEQRQYPLPDDLYGGSKDWRAGSYHERVEWLHLMYEGAKEEIERLGQPQVEQEPVAWQGRDGYLYHFIEEPKPGDCPLYTHPQNLSCKSTQARLATLWGYERPQPPRQPLTDQQIHDCFQHRHRDKATERRMITRAIEFAHGITGEKE